MPATELTDERRRDLELIQMRDAIDLKTHYRKPERDVLPKYFQVRPFWIHFVLVHTSLSMLANSIQSTADDSLKKSNSSFVPQKKTIFYRLDE